MSRRKIVCLEFNELCPDLLHRWMQEGALPNFRKFYESSDVFTVLADEPGPDNLEPWIQWYSMHTGLPYKEHGVQNLTDGPIKNHPDVWHLLAEAGFRVASCGSMNTRAVEAKGCLFVPDPWCTNQSAYPAQWNAYHRVVAGMVQDSTLDKIKALSSSDFSRFAAFLASHGLRPKTVSKVVAQLWSDTILKQPTKWKRAALLDKLQFDVFKSYWRTNRPDFSTFFLNSTAHFQHAYWHCAFPEQFDVRPEQTEIDLYSSAILFGYQQMDELLADFAELEKEGAMLMFCTALSQQGVRRSDRVFYRPKNVDALLARVGCKAVEVLPVMSEQFNVRFARREDAELARSRLVGLRLKERPLIYIGYSEENTLFIGAATRTAVEDSAEVSGFPDGSTAVFSEFFYRLPTTKATTHHPESLLWVKRGAHRVHSQPISLLDWLPGVLSYFGITGSKDGSTVPPILPAANDLGRAA